MFYAHSTPHRDKRDWQSLQNHLQAVADRAASFAAAFGAASLARVAGLLHDLGKYTEAFQRRLLGSPERVDHSTWGACVAIERYKALGHVLAYAIAGHHAGLPNGHEGKKRTALRDRLNPEPNCPLDPVWERELSLPALADLRLADFQVAGERRIFQQSFLGRMPFSCLVDADYLDTEEFYLRCEGELSRRPSEHPSLQQLRERLDSHLSSFDKQREINRARAEILKHVRANADLSPGKFSLTVPTGGGKTLASLAFALDHAIRHGLRRVIFVIPFTSIAEQNATAFRDALGDLGDSAVLEHHSSYSDSSTEERAGRDKLRLAMENWDYPVVVTTAVQFFESLFADRPSRCRKLHNIASSVVILDEAQTLPLKVLRPCVAALDELALNYHTSIVLCTATQPALLAEDSFRDGFSNAHGYDFVFLFDVINGNPNGDPDAGNLPRLDPETNQGIVTDVCLKRKIRNYVALEKEGVQGYAIYMQERSVLNQQHEKAWKALQIAADAKDAYKKLPKDEAKARELAQWMCTNFFDVRAVGAV